MFKTIKCYSYIFILYSILFFSCGKAGSENATTKGTGEYTVTGNILHLKRGKVLLQQVEGEKLITRDSTELSSSGGFKVTVKSPEPDFYVLKINDTLVQLLVLDNDKIKLSADGNNFLNTIKVEGSKATTDYLNFNKQVNIFLEKENAVKADMPKLFKTNNLDSLKGVQVKLTNAQKNTNDFVKHYIDSVVPSMAVFNFIQYLNIQSDFSYLVDLSKRLNEKMPDSKYTKLLSVEVNKILEEQKKAASSGVSVGAVAPEISLPNPEDKIVKLSSFKGKFVLLDFWASWCGPCRQESPNMVKLYNKYKGKNLEIFGVSLDRDKFAWVKAIKTDQLVWTQVSDLKFWDSAVVPLYNLEGIPATFLIGPDGKVIAKDLRGEELDKKISEVIK